MSAVTVPWGLLDPSGDENVVELFQRSQIEKDLKEILG